MCRVLGCAESSDVQRPRMCRNLGCAESLDVQNHRCAEFIGISVGTDRSLGNEEQGC